jgi:UbiD family decarboxylase
MTQTPAPARTGGHGQMGTPRQDGMREWIGQVSESLERDQFRIIPGASSEAEIGAITEMLDHSAGSPCVLFDAIPGYPEGRRVIVNTNGTVQRQAVTLGLDPANISHESLLDFWGSKLRSLKPLEPEEIDGGPILENVLRGDAIDLEAFPAPIWHPKAGGRYLGTASVNILRDLDSDWINAGTYRNQVLARDRLGIYISPGKHGNLIRRQYFDRKKACPAVVLVGVDPLIFMAACSEAPRYGMDELAWAGAVRGTPIRVIRGEVTGLPIPAEAEIAIEGWIDPVERMVEGPYGEAYGYYSGVVSECPFVRVERIYHRNDPIILGCPQGKPPHEDNRFGAYLRSSSIREHIENAGVPNVTGVWIPPEVGNRGFVVVAIRQSYPGHAAQAGIVASQVAGAAYLGRYVVVVDEDIDIYDLSDVWWAIMTRMDPQRDAQLLRRAWSGALDQAVEPDRRGTNSRLIIDATRPWEWRERFADPVTDLQRAAAIRERWGWLLERSPAPT